MTTTEHVVVKPEKLAATAVGMLEQELVIPNLFTKQGIDQFRGASDDSVSVPVEGVLPFHEYAWRNDRSQPLQFDTYNERKIVVSFGGNFYSGVKLTDEQFDMDFQGWSKLLRVQSRAVARGLEHGAISTLKAAPYQVTVGDCAADIKGSLVEARRVLNAFHAPGDRYMVVGTDWESLMLSADELGLAQNVGDSTAESLLVEASIGSRYGFRIVVDQTIDPSSAYAFAGSGFIFSNAAPSVPQSIKAGGTASYEGIALRWLRDYDPDFLQDRSVVNTYAGFREVTDVLVGWDDVNQTEIVSAAEYFVRGIELVLDGASVYPTGELATITGVNGPGKHLKGAAATIADD